MVLGAEVLDGLNPAQQEAVETVDGPLLIIAGPGSGKTRVITHRIAYLVRARQTSPYSIAAVTFTNKASREMRERLHRLVGAGAESLTVGTFHAFCARLLRLDGDLVGLNSNYSIYDSDDQIAMVKQALELAELDPKRVHPRAVQSVISKAKSLLLDARGLEQSADNYFDETCARVYHFYEELLARNNAVDFDDLLLKAVQLFRSSDAVREKYQQRYRYLMIDEFQDTNIAQYRLAQLLTGEEHNICVVGDPDQSIYSWRNADIRNILSFQKDYPETKTIALEQNYRSTGTILAAAKSLISSNGQRLDKDLFTDNGSGVPLVVHEAYDEAEEAGFVISEVDRLVRQEKVKPGDCAVMYRVNAQSRALEEACLHKGIKYRLVGGVRFYQRREVKDLIAYLNLLSNPQDEVNLSRVINVPPRGIGAKSMQELVRYSHSEGVSLYGAMQQVAFAKAQGQPVPARITGRAAASVASFITVADRLIGFTQELKVVDLIDRVLEESGLRSHIQNSDDSPDERWENILELREIAREFNAENPPNGLATLLERLSLVADVDNYEESEESMTLITLHQAKGLEFPVVFIVGLEEGILPHSRSMESAAEVEEERRLCYVGITRAQQRLYLLRAFRRGFMGNTGPTLASRFLREIPSELIGAPVSRPVQAALTSNVAKTDTWVKIATQSAPTPNRPVLNVGDRVTHTAFGEGVVMENTAVDGDYEVTVQFAQGVGEKRLLLSFAPLEKLAD
ncbi:MAG: UvrD-helicase domain-containing protein [Chloroflexi bacterium]|nr:UvrD-helicase domain-containing protein [Chloroflexota bacterium]